MKKLTDKQKSIIEDLTSEFLRINETSNIKGNLINVSEILGIKTQTKDLIEEIKLHNQIEVQKRKEQCLSDYDKIVADIKALGLCCNIFATHNDETLNIIIANDKQGDADNKFIDAKPHHENCIEIRYTSKYSNSIQLPDKTGYHTKHVGILIKIDNYVYKDIESCVGGELFSNRLLRYIK